LKAELERLARSHPSVIAGVRGLGFMLGVELQPKDRIAGMAASDKPASLQLVNRLHEAGVMTIPSGAQVVRLLPALNTTRHHFEEGLTVIEKVVRSFA
jgi:4-aminobutyrate aminotransferase-like enzyme